MCSTKLFKSSVFLMMSFLPCVVWAELSVGQQNKLKSTFSQILTKDKVNLDRLSLIVGTDKVAYQLNEKKSVIPASLTKIATAAAVLKNIAPGTKFETGLYSASEVKSGVLKGDLCLKGGGDPGFVSESMWFLVNALTRHKLQKIEGNLLVDDSLFDSQRFDLSRQSERVDRAYDAPIGAMSFNWNSVNVFVRPAMDGKGPAEVFLDPESSYATLLGQVSTKGSGVDVNADREATAKGDSIRVGGRIGASSPEQAIYKSISKPDLWAGEQLKSFLAQRKITVSGEVKNQKCANNAKKLADVQSRPVESLVTDMNKFSNNFVAEILTKQLSVVVNNEQGNIAGGMKVIESVLLEYGLQRSDFSLINPSGLTRENKMTAKSLHSLLWAVQKDFSLFPEFAMSLPIAGVDGTLKRRMKSKDSSRGVRAKTGLLTGVVGLAGYAGLSDGTWVPFVFIYNGPEDGTRVRALFDRLAVEISNL